MNDEQRLADERAADEADIVRPMLRRRQVELLHLMARREEIRCIKCGDIDTELDCAQIATVLRESLG